MLTTTTEPALAPAACWENLPAVLQIAKSQPNGRLEHFSHTYVCITRAQSTLLVMEAFSLDARGGCRVMPLPVGAPDEAFKGAWEGNEVMGAMTGAIAGVVAMLEACRGAWERNEVMGAMNGGKAGVRAMLGACSGTWEGNGVMGAMNGARAGVGAMLECMGPGVGAMGVSVLGAGAGTRPLEDCGAFAEGPEAPAAGVGAADGCILCGEGATASWDGVMAGVGAPEGCPLDGVGAGVGAPAGRPLDGVGAVEGCPLAGPGVGAPAGCPLTGPGVGAVDGCPFDGASAGLWLPAGPAASSGDGADAFSSAGAGAPPVVTTRMSACPFMILEMSADGQSRCRDSTGLSTGEGGRKWGQQHLQQEGQEIM